MDDTAEFLTTIGGILLFGLLTDFLGRYTFLPRVTLLLLFGLLIGHEGLDLISSVVSERFEIITNMALLMVGFLLGGKLTGESLRSCGSQLFWISVSAVAGTWLAVLLGLLTIGVQLEVAILLACVATATAPAATLDVVVETGSKGRFANLLLEIVAIDDVWALILFAFGVSLVALMMGTEEGAATILSAFWQIGGALLLGVAIGVPAAYLSGRIRPGQPMLIEALGLVFLCGGIAIWLDLSYLIASMVMGAVIVNLARHHDYPFHAIENVDSPMMVIFFVFAGASLELNALVGGGGSV
jgi:NhaP-type Na+/H+ or K+/H+ antiporter